MKANSSQTGLSDHHHMIHTILKTKLKSINQKNQFTAISYNIIVNQFKLDICNSMSAMRTHAASKNIFISILYKHAPKKTKNLRGNLRLHFNKNLRKQIIIRLCLKNKANKSENPSDIVKFK